MLPTTKGAKTSASKKPHSGSFVKSKANQEITAPNINNSPCATFTILITPKTKDKPSAINASTNAVTVPSNKAKKNSGPLSINQLITILLENKMMNRRMVNPPDENKGKY